MSNIDRRKKACDLFNSGYNCAQSVACAFEDILPLDRQTILNASIAFGGGFGRTRNLCGAVSAIGLILGLLEKSDLAIDKEKADIYKKIQQLDSEFKTRNGSDNCGELLKNVKNLTSGYVPQTRDGEYYASRPCIKFVLDSVDILENFLDIQDK